jgi:hypothetical protein
MRTTADEMLARAVLVCILLPAWAMILDVIYKVSIVAVVRGTKQWEDWYPLFGSVNDAYTVRNFWG